MGAWREVRSRGGKAEECPSGEQLRQRWVSAVRPAAALVVRGFMHPHASMYRLLEADRGVMTALFPCQLVMPELLKAWQGYSSGQLICSGQCQRNIYGEHTLVVPRRLCGGKNRSARGHRAHLSPLLLTDLTVRSSLTMPVPMSSSLQFTPAVTLEPLLCHCSQAASSRMDHVLQK